MMKADPSERASITDLLEDEWVTANGTDEVDTKVMRDVEKSRSGFGNLDRVMSMFAQAHGRTSMNLIDK